MNARTETELLLPPMHSPARLSNTHLDALEEETVFILREVAAAFERPTLLFSGGKDSLVLLKCAEKAFGAGRIPYPLLMIDTGHNFPEVTAYRDQRAKELGAELIVRNVEDSIEARHRAALAHPARVAQCAIRRSHCSRPSKPIPLRRALIGGARRDEEKARAKERIFSHRDSFGQWQPKEQRPELWTLFNTRIKPRANTCARVPHLATGPNSMCGSTSRARTGRRCRRLYYTHDRQVIERRKGLLVPVTELTPPLATTKTVATVRDVRFRTVGDITTAPARSKARPPTRRGRSSLETLSSRR
jgi:sulfate adenylyltransferase subunit 2